MLRWAVLALLLLAAPSASALPGSVITTVTPDEVGTTLYFHLLNIQDFPINTQLPDPAYNDQAHFGAGASTLTCVARLTGGQNTAGIDQEYHTFYGYSSPSFVEYNNIQNGVPRTFPERQLGANVTLAGSQAVAHWFLTPSADNDVLSPIAQTAALDQAVAVPNVVVRMEARSGDAISVDDKSFNQGPILMSGQTDPVTLVSGQALTASGQPSSQVTETTIGGRDVYDFAVPLAIANGTILQDHGFSLRIDVFLDNPACGDPQTTGDVMPNLVQVYADAAALPRLEVRNKDPLFVPAGLARTWNQDGTVLVGWGASSPWGNYDVDAANLTLDILGPSRPVSLDRLSVVQRTHEHYHHADPVTAVWQWNTTKDQPKDGAYTAVLRVPNLQHTATVETRIAFTIGDGLAMPALPAPFLLLAMACAAAAMRKAGARPPAP